MVKDNIIPNHMDIYWHDYTGHIKDKPITEASVPVKAALIGRVGLMLLSCGTGAWRVRSSMNAISEQLGVTCTSSIGLMTIVYTCFDGHKTFTNSLCLNNTGVNTSKLDRLERFVKKFPTDGVHKSGEQLHQELDEIEKALGIEFEGDFDTLNGFMTDKLEHIPKEGEDASIEYKGYFFKVMDVDDNVIQTVKVYRSVHLDEE